MSQPELTNPYHLVPSTHQPLSIWQALVVTVPFSLPNLSQGPSPHL